MCHRLVKNNSKTPTARLRPIWPPSGIPGPNSAVTHCGEWLPALPHAGSTRSGQRLWELWPARNKSQSSRGARAGDAFAWMETWRSRRSKIGKIRRRWSTGWHRPEGKRRRGRWTMAQGSRAVHAQEDTSTGGGARAGSVGGRQS
jgi:hypothetical protein